MKEFVGIRAKTYSYPIHHISDDRKAKSTIKVLKKPSNLNIIRTVQTQINLKIDHLRIMNLTQILKNRKGLKVKDSD